MCIGSRDVLGVQALGLGAARPVASPLNKSVDVGEREVEVSGDDVGCEQPAPWNTHDEVEIVREPLCPLDELIAELGDAAKVHVANG